MKSILKKGILSVITSATFLTLLPIAANAEWKQEGENKYYINEDGSKARGWRQIDGKWYYFDETNGVMVKDGVVVSKLKEYHLDADGAWIQDKNSVTSNTAKIGDTEGLWILKEDKKWYFKDKNGVMLKNTTIISNGNKIMLDENGAANQNGALATVSGENDLIEGATANVASTNGEWVYDEAAQNSYFQDKTGKRLTGWIAYNHRWCYLDKQTGLRLKDTIIDGYKLNEVGAYADDKIVDLTTAENAHKNTDAYKVESKSWKKEGDNWYYYNEMNEKVTGWQEFKGDMYYFNNNGIMQKNTTINVDGVECTLGEDGAWTKINFIQKTLNP